MAGTDVRLVWQVDDEDGQNDYRAIIVLRHPKGADVSVVSTMTDLEKVRLISSKKLAVTEAGVQVEVPSAGPRVGFIPALAAGSILEAAFGERYLEIPLMVMGGGWVLLGYRLWPVAPE